MSDEKPPIDWSDGKAPAGRVIDDPEQDKLADDVMDEIQWCKSSQYQGPVLGDKNEVIEPEKSTVEREELERIIREWMVQFGAAVSDRLQPAGLACERMSMNGDRDGFIVRCRDRDGRVFDADLKYDEYFAAEMVSESAGRVMLATVCDRIVEARRRYFARML
jgi:hypothetical protein